MRPLEEKAAEFIRTHGLFAEATGILLAVSGGADSIALLHVMHALVLSDILRTELVCAHINHQLRGAQSDADEAFVREQASKLDVPSVISSVDVAAYAEKHKLSIETAARELRLASLAKIVDNHCIRWIATGHQKNDNAETLVHRLGRGTGFRGLASIRPWRQWNDGLRMASPLLDCRREEINAYLRNKGIPWREDQSNHDCRHRRNFIRQRLLPTLQKECESPLIEDLSALAISAGRLYHQIAKAANQAASAAVVRSKRETIIKAAAIADLLEPVAVELIRRELAHLGCGERDLTRRHYRRILELAQEEATGKIVIPNGFVVSREQDKIIIGKPQNRSGRSVPDLSIELTIPGTSRFDTYRIDSRIIDHSATHRIRIKEDKSPFIEYLDLDRIARPISVRYRQNGDRFQPLGMTAVKKVGKFLTAAKIPRSKRDEVLVVYDSQCVLWLCPIRLSQQACVSPDTRRVLELRVTKETGRNDN